VGTATDHDRESWTAVLSQVRRIVERGGSRDEILLSICRLLREEIGHYDWVGFYLVDASRKMLRLGPYDGAPTRHVEIPFGQGVCGLAAEKERGLMVPDVSKVVNYLSCSPKVQSEFVVPVFAEEAMAAELDVDSHTRGAFGEQDKEFLESVAETVSRLF
jgi:GAF domain-containing protein